MYLMKKLNKNILNFSVLLLIFILFTFMYFYYNNIKEGLKHMELDTNLNTDFAKSFCELNQSSGQELKEKCPTLTEKNCRSTTCCIWTSNGKCDAGGKDGLLFNTEPSGKPITLDYYYYKDTCYGKKCPKM
jgi:energy-coupling factor transporter transmembrane protein EcfT